MDDKLCIINKKPQTTRHRILAIYNDEDHQIVFSDTPGIITDPSYKMQEVMNKFAYSTFEDADILILMIDCLRKQEENEIVSKKIKQSKTPIYLVINKIDLASRVQINESAKYMKAQYEFDETFEISAKDSIGIKPLFDKILLSLPEGPAYYPKDQLTDKPEKFFVAEMIRGQILELYHQEIPYSCELEIEEFKETQLRGEDFVRIRAIIHVSRKSQKAIIIGKKGSAIKELGIRARRDIEDFLGKKSHLELYVKVSEDWRDNTRKLNQFGYR